MSLTSRTFGWLRDGLGNLLAAREIEAGLSFNGFGLDWYVNPDATNASDDNNSGRSKAEPLSTVAEAESRMTDNNDDVCYMSGVSAHALTTELTITKNRLHFVGAGGPFRSSGQRTRWELGITTGSEIGLVQNTGNGNTFHNIKMRSVDTNGLYCFADGGEHTMLDHCALEFAVLLTTAGVAELLANGDTSVYQDCTIGNTIYQINAARQAVLFTGGTISGKKARDVNFKRCEFLVDTASTTYVFLRATIADIERKCILTDCVGMSSKLSSALQNEGIGIASALTQGRMILKNCSWDNITHVATAASGVFGSDPAFSAAATGGLTTEMT